MPERTARFQIFFHRRVIPIREVGDEVEQRAAELFRIIEQCGILPSFLEPLSAFLAEQTLPFVRSPSEHLGADLVAKTCGAKFIRWVRPKRGANHRAASCKRPPRPPDVQRGNVPVSNRLLAPGVGGYALDG